MAHPNEEKETTANYDYIDDTWNVYTCVPKHITKLNKISTPYWTEIEDGRIIAGKWRLKGSQVRFATENVTKMSDERKEASRQRMFDMHSKRASIVRE
ncbi:hypothetical protein FHS16_001757 [Paenibacillus endophyticus]|uniref:Uncharacterized protein n=1 Tax=Paenibacillus endophyticus TaxID=1294268 RepID=A0A7W5C5U1_9BACL|nr:hypothetical protein [Paenibacillus endophyticus]MBB3151711.1 hypothetical protein [Paenibacillus endophyticus]